MLSNRPKYRNSFGYVLATGKPAPTRLQKIKDFVFTGQLPFVSSPAPAEEQAIQQKVHTIEYQISSRAWLPPIAAAAIGLGSLGVPVVAPLGVAVMVYITLPFIRLGYLQLVKQKRVGLDVVSAVLMGGVLLSGQFLVYAIFHTLNSFTYVLLTQTYRLSQNSLTSLFDHMAKEAWVRHDGNELRVPLNEIQAGDVVVVHAGEMIPVDGIVAQGAANVDQSALTGEARPVERGVADEVWAGTVVLSGDLDIQVTKTGEDTTIATIMQVLNNTTQYTSTLQLKGMEIAQRSVVPTLALSLGSMPFIGVVRSLGVLFSYFGSPMRGLAPLSVLTFLKIASDNNMLVKDGRALETLTDIDTVVFDKTGTLTDEQPHVAALHPCATFSHNDLLYYAAAIEQKQSHPIARAILAAAEHLTLPPLDDVAYDVGYGLSARVDGKLVRIGSARFLDNLDITLPASLASTQAASHAAGHTLVYVTVDETVAGAIELHATVRPEATSIVQALQARGLQTIIISGDHELPARHLAAALGIDTYYAEVLPTDKARLIRELQADGRRVCFVGDGINDAIALKQAHVSVSLLGATTIATDTADVVLMDGSLRSLNAMFDLAHQLDSTMRSNMVFAIVPGVAVLGGIYLLHFGIVTAGVVSFIGFWVGIGNAVRPGVQHYFATRLQASAPPPTPTQTARFDTSGALHLLGQ